ncbi:hypothetical protein BS50DRAFT_592487 [Corynespora cassiicola Philippines]|uniref:Pal1-domain-containing protein n=1 Tax=Corynespora cassiicola Philippines TaxID=1448308 RepID=A0A2T2NA30_CORCC|nr:hypothetical protein BS50DRAFT_592487 [Corynespora cassiicola Philippines]
MWAPPNQPIEPGLPRVGDTFTFEIDENGNKYPLGSAAKTYHSPSDHHAAVSYHARRQEKGSTSQDDSSITKRNAFRLSRNQATPRRLQKSSSNNIQGAQAQAPLKFRPISDGSPDQYPSVSRSGLPQQPERHQKDPRVLASIKPSGITAPSYDYGRLHPPQVHFNPPKAYSQRHSIGSPELTMNSVYADRDYLGSIRESPKRNFIRTFDFLNKDGSLALKSPSSDKKGKTRPSKYFGRGKESRSKLSKIRRRTDG